MSSLGLTVGFEMIAAGTGLEEGQGGSAGYYEGLLRPLADDPRISKVIVYVARWYDHARSWRHPKIVLRLCSVPKARPPRVLYEQLAIPLRCKRDRIDVLFSTGNYRPLLYRSPTVVGLHAIQHFLLGGEIGRLRSTYLKFTVPRSVRGADFTIAVSETLRRDAIRLFDLDPERVVSVPMGPSPWLTELAATDVAAVEPYRTPDGSPYVLCISRLYALKNHQRLITAFARLVQTRQFPYALVIVGGDADVTSAQLERAAREAGIEERVHLLGRVAQAEVPGLYAGAAAIAYVSLYETFGHPVLEAFAMGRPLVTSSVGGTAEVAGGAAQLVNPEDIEDIARGLHDVLANTELRERLVEAGRRRVLEFSWKRCASETADILARAAERGPPRRQSV